MKKVLIITYFFPPCTFTGSYRLFSWAKYLSEFGYYPIIITRRWDKKISSYKDMSASTDSDVLHQKSSNYEVYYLPYKENLRDKLYKKYGDKKFVLLRKLLSFAEFVLQNFTIKIVPYRNIYTFSKKILKQQDDIVCILTSGNPYALFNFCRKLSKQYKIPWIADYRDDWTTSQWLTNLRLTEKILFILERRSEKKWLKNAACFTSISPFYVSLISSFIKKPGFVVMNGFEPEDYITEQNFNENFNTFTIVFNGSLYDTQPIDIFIEGFKNFTKTIPESPNVKMCFLGLNFEEKQVMRIKKMIHGYEHFFEFTDRIDKNDAINFMRKSHVFLMCAHTNIKGVTSSKIFDYLALEKPVILCPSDNEILENIIVSTNSGYICNTSQEVCTLLNNLYDEYKRFGAISHNPNKNKIYEYTRYNQTYELSKAIDYATKNYSSK